MTMIREIVDELTTELQISEGDRFNPVLLESKVKAAYRDVRTARKYPKSYTEAAIESDMEDYFSQVRDIAMYDYNQIGAEGQTSYSQDGVSVHYVERNKLFAGVLPIAVTS